MRSIYNIKAACKWTRHRWIFHVVSFAHAVVCRCVLLGVVVQSLKPVKRLARSKWTQQLPELLGQQCWELLCLFARSFSNELLLCCSLLIPKAPEENLAER